MSREACRGPQSPSTASPMILSLTRMCFQLAGLGTTLQSLFSRRLISIELTRNFLTTSTYQRARKTKTAFHSFLMSTLVKSINSSRLAGLTFLWSPTRTSASQLRICSDTRRPGASSATLVGSCLSCKSQRGRTARNASIGARRRGSSTSQPGSGSPPFSRVYSICTTRRTSASSNTRTSRTSR
jgi:hypothetical protein